MESGGCDNCGNANWVCDPSRGETVCVDCGLVLPDRAMDEHEERISRTDSKNHDRTQQLDAYFASFTKTRIATKKGGIVPSTVATAQKRLEARGSLHERQLDVYFGDIRDFCTMFEFPKSVSDYARSLVVDYQKNKKIDDTRAVDSKALAICVLMLACAKLSKGITLRVMLGYATDVSESDVRKVRKKLLLCLPEAHSATRTVDIVAHQCVLLDLDMSVESVAVAVLQKCESLVEGKTPSCIAGCCIIIACGLLDKPIDKSDVAAAAQLVVGTLDNLCRAIRKSYNPVLTSAEVRKAQGK